MKNLTDSLPEKAFFFMMANTGKFTPLWIVVLTPLVLSIVCLTYITKMKDFENGLTENIMLLDKIGLQIGYVPVLAISALTKRNRLFSRSIHGKRYSTLPIDPCLKRDGPKHASSDISNCCVLRIAY